MIVRLRALLAVDFVVEVAQNSTTTNPTSSLASFSQYSGQAKLTHRIRGVPSTAPRLEQIGLSDGERMECAAKFANESLLGSFSQGEISLACPQCLAGMIRGLGARPNPQFAGNRITVTVVCASRAASRNDKCSRSIFSTSRCFNSRLYRCCARSIGPPLRLTSVMCRR